MAPPPIKPAVPPEDAIAVLPATPRALTSLVQAPPTPAPAAPVVVQPLPIARTNNATLPPSSLTSASTLKKRSSIQTVVVAAGATFPVAAYGNRWQLLYATCPLPIRYDATAGFSTYTPGLGLMIATDAEFNQLEVQNPYLFPITATLYFGWDEQAAFTAPLFPATVMEGYALFNGSSQNFLTFTTPTLIIGGNVVLNGTQGPIGHLYFRNGYFYGIQAGLFTPPQTANANAAYIGRSSRMMDIIPQGGWVQYLAPQGQLFDLGNFWVKGTASNDGVYFQLT